MIHKVSISAIVPVTERVSDAAMLYHAYKEGVAATGQSYEFVYVLDGLYPDVLAALKTLQSQGEPIRIITLAKWFGEATALTIGFGHARGDVILTLPAYLQVDPAEIPKLVSALDGYDMVVARRYPRSDSKLNILQSAVFHLLIRSMIEVQFHDLGCGVRVFSRRVTEEISLYGDQQRFLPLLANRLGFKVREVEAKQAEADKFQRVYSPGVYVRRFLDILTIVFIVKFTRKPLRFFGLIGTFTLGIGAISTLFVAVERLVFGVPLADRPALALAVLMIILGFQMIAVGLIGELIIFTHARDAKEYTVDQIIENVDAPEPLAVTAEEKHA